MDNKTLLQKLQSRISKRRDIIAQHEDKIRYFTIRELYVPNFYAADVRRLKAEVKEEVQWQKLDKKLLAMLLEKQREDAHRVNQHFYSKYSSVAFEGW